jgi:hypothetical protein
MTANLVTLALLFKSLHFKDEIEKSQVCRICLDREAVSVTTSLFLCDGTLSSNQSSHFGES